MTDKRYTWNSKEVVINDNLTGNKFEVIDITEIDVLLGLLNEQDQRIKALESVLEFATDTITEHCSKKRIKELQEYMKSEGVVTDD